MSPSSSRLLIGKTHARCAFNGMSKGNDPRGLRGSFATCGWGFADIILIGERAKVEAALTHDGKAVEEEGLSIHDPADSGLSAGFSVPQPRFEPRGAS